MFYPPPKVFGNYIFHDATSNLLFQIQQHKYYNKKYKRCKYFIRQKNVILSPKK